MNEEIRWEYRYANFSRAFTLLSNALENGADALNDLEREGVIQRFEYTFELAWKTIKDRLEHDGLEINPVTPRNVIREAHSALLIEDGDAWIAMLGDRNLMSHTYDEEDFRRVVGNIEGGYLRVLGATHARLGKEMRPHKQPDLKPATMKMLMRIFAAYPELKEVILFGSRATGKAKPHSDIDLATHGILGPDRLGMLKLDLEDSDIVQKCDVVAYEHIRYAPFKRHIDAHGVAIYRSGG